jgi:hypothetical protein
MIALRKQARTRRLCGPHITTCSESAHTLAYRYRVTRATFYWRTSNETLQDRSHTAHRL